MQNYGHYGFLSRKRPLADIVCLPIDTVLMVANDLYKSSGILGGG